MTTNNERLEAIKFLKAERANPTVKCRKAKGVPVARIHLSSKRHASVKRWARQRGHVRLNK